MATVKSAILETILNSSSAKNYYINTGFVCVGIAIIQLRIKKLGASREHVHHLFQRLPQVWLHQSFENIVGSLPTQVTDHNSHLESIFSRTDVLEKEPITEQFCQVATLCLKLPPYHILTTNFFPHFYTLERRILHA